MFFDDSTSLITGIDQVVVVSSGISCDLLVPSTVGIPSYAADGNASSASGGGGEPEGFLKNFTANVSKVIKTA